MVKKSGKTQKDKSSLILKQSSALVHEHGKLPPQAIELEEAVLGALMLEKDALTDVIEKHIALKNQRRGFDRCHW